MKTKIIIMGMMMIMASMAVNAFTKNLTDDFNAISIVPSMTNFSTDVNPKGCGTLADSSCVISWNISIGGQMPLGYYFVKVIVNSSYLGLVNNASTGFNNITLAGKGVIPVGLSAGSPFYIYNTSDTNPKACLNNPLIGGDSCSASWEVKSSLAGMWTLFVTATSDSINVSTVNSQEINVTITSGADTTFSVMFPSGLSMINFTPALSTSKNVAPIGQTDNLSILNVSNQGNTAFSVYLNMGDELPSGISIFANTASVCGACKNLSINKSIVSPNLQIYTTASIWMWSNFSNTAQGEYANNLVVSVNETI